MIRLLMLALLAPPAQAEDFRYTYQAEVVSIYDGDTLTVDIDLGLGIWQRDRDLRLFCINAPEVRGPDKAAGLAVRDEVRGWMPVGSTIQIETILDRSEKYGRVLAMVTPAGWTETVNARLYRQGQVRIEAYTPQAVATCIARLD